MNHGWIRRGKAATKELRLTRIARIDSNFDRKAKTAKRRFGDFVIFAISAVKRLGTKQQLAPLCPSVFVRDGYASIPDQSTGRTDS